MGSVEKTAVRKLLHDPELTEEIARAVVDDPEAMDSLADEIADKLSDELEDDESLKAKIIEGAMASPDFKKRIVRKLVDDLS